MQHQIGTQLISRILLSEPSFIGTDGGNWQPTFPWLFGDCSPSRWKPVTGKPCLGGIWPECQVRTSYFSQESHLAPGLSHVVLHLDCVPFLPRAFILDDSAQYDHVLDEPFQYGAVLPDEVESVYGWDEDWDYFDADFIDGDVQDPSNPEPFVIVEAWIPYVVFHDDWFWNLTMSTRKERDPVKAQEFPSDELTCRTTDNSANKKQETKCSVYGVILCFEKERNFQQIKNVSFAIWAKNLLRGRGCVCPLDEDSFLPLPQRWCQITWGPSSSSSFLAITCPSAIGSFMLSPGRAPARTCSPNIISAKHAMTDRLSTKNCPSGKTPSIV